MPDQESQDSAPTPPNPHPTIPFDPDSLRTAPRVFSNYCQCNLDGDNVVLIFAQRQTAKTKEEEATTVAVAQSICFMTLGQFLQTADMLAAQAVVARGMIASVPPETVIHDLLYPGGGSDQS